MVRWLASGGKERESGSDETVHSSSWWHTVTDYEEDRRDHNQMCEHNQDYKQALITMWWIKLAQGALHYAMISSWQLTLFSSATALSIIGGLLH